MGDPIEDYRRHLYDAYHAASRDYDQAILTISAATLALSVTFLHDITPTPKPGTVVILVIAWIALGIALGVMVASFIASQRAIRTAITGLDIEPGTRGPTRNGLAASVTVGLNIIAGIALGAGLGLLGVYAVLNVGG